MKKYNCNRCNNYSTDCRQNFWSHQNRTKKCGKTTKETRCRKMPKNAVSLVSNSIPIVSVSNEHDLSSLTCEYCGKVFTQNGSMNRHKRRSCKVRKKQERERQEALQLQRPIIVNNTTNNNTTNNNNNTIDNSQHITNNININAFGYENTEHLKNIIFQCLLESNYAESMKKLTQFVYNDPKHPENHTVDMRNDQTKYAKIADGKGGFEKRTKKEIVLLVIDNNYLRFDRCMEENPRTQFTCGGLNHLNSHRDTKREKKELFNEVQCVLINRSMPREEEEEE